MNHQDERRLIRLLHGELDADERDRLEGRLEHDAQLRRRLADLRSAWESLEEAPFAGVPPDFRDDVMAGARRLRDNDLSWSAAPAWVRLGATAALLLGVGLGVGVGERAEPTATATATAEIAVQATEITVQATESDYATDELAEPLSLAETFWMGLEDDDTSGDGEVL